MAAENRQHQSSVAGERHINISWLSDDPRDWSGCAVHAPGDDTNSGTAIAFDDRNLVRVNVLITRRAHLLLRRQVHPELKTRHAFGPYLRHFFMQDPAPGAHPLQITRTDFAGIPYRISMPDGTREQISHRFDAAMRMERKTGLVIRRVRRLEMIEKQKWIEIIQRMSADTPLQSNAGALDDTLRSIGG